MHSQMGNQAQVGAFAHHGGPAVPAGRPQRPGDDRARDLIGADAGARQRSRRSAAEAAGATSRAIASARSTRAAETPPSRPWASPMISLASSARPIDG